MEWLVIVAVLAAIGALHEVVVWGLARALGGEARRRRVYAAVSGRRRVALAFAGAIAALYVVLCGLGVVYGREVGLPTGRQWLVVAEVKPGYPATGKLQPGDRIDAVDGEPITPAQSLVQPKHGATVTLTIVRDGRQLDVAIEPMKADDHWLIGIVPTIEHETENSYAVVLPAALRYPPRYVATIAHELGVQLFGSDQADPGGPRRIYQEFQARQDVARQLAWNSLLRLAVILALALVALDLVRAGRLVVLGSAA